MIRKAQEGEASKVYEILLEGKAYMREKGNPQWDGDYPSLALVQTSLASTYVEEDNGEIRGVITVQEGPESYYGKIDGKYVLDTERYYVFHRLAVKKEHRGKGIAKDLIRFASLLAKENGMLSLRADTGKRNQTMQSLLFSMGFIDCGTVQDGDLALEVFEKPLP